MRRLLPSIALLLAFGLLGDTAAAGGGSWMEPYRASYRPGETVVMRGDAGSGSLGSIDDGPFFAYLRVDPKSARAANRDTYPNIHESDIYLGELQLKGREPWFIEVSITFTLPADLPDGDYEIVYCNDPCSSGFGDFLGGWVTVKTPPPPPSPRRASLIAFSPIHPL